MAAKWTGEVVEELARLRAAGVRTFDVAWAYAMEAVPPGQMETGGRQIRLAFDGEESVASFLERRARLEWEGLCVDDFAAGLRALLEPQRDDFVEVKRAVHSHRPAGTRLVA